jgi:UDP-N-acetylmuramoylalanine--D-glutamate ligase
MSSLLSPLLVTAEGKSSAMIIVVFFRVVHMLASTIIGLGRSGIAGAKILQKQGYAVTISDRGQSENLIKLKEQISDLNITVKLGDSFQPSPETQLVVVSPGVPWDLSALVKAREMRIETIGELELAWRELQDIPWVGITGTNGKTTVTSIVAAIFQAAGLDAPACGNIGLAACEIALRPEKPQWIIGEISSYQVESISTLKPRIGVFTTFTADHLARHKTLENYYEIKSKLLKNSEFQVLNGDDSYLASRVKDWPQAHWTSVEGADRLPANPQWGTWIADGWVIWQGERIVPLKDLQMPGDHNRQNLLMAVATARLAGIEAEAIQQAVSSFSGVSHRLEYVCTHQAVKYINDSKATNYDAAEVGLNAVEAPVILIAGGDPKEGDDQGWMNVIKQKAAAVLLIGVAAEQFAEQLRAVGFEQFEIVETMARAVPRSAELAKQNGAKVVLLSPACASFDQYRSFEERGDNFRQLCLQLLS